MGRIREKILEWYPHVFAKRKFYNFNNFLIDLGLKGIGILNYKNHEISGETHFIDFITKNYKLDVVFDVGANEGDYANLFLNHQSQIYCFEPHPITYIKLNKKFANNSNVQTFQLGFSNEESKSLIYDYSHNSGSQHASLYKEVITSIHGSKADAIEIELSTINNFMKQVPQKRINLLKIDTEGNELNVLKGASEVIMNNLVDIIHIEFNEMNVISKVFLKDFVNFLEHYNFYRLLPKEILPLKYVSNPLKFEIFAFQNIVAFRKDIDKLA